MPLLTDQGLTPDAYVRAVDGEPLPTEGAVLVTLARLKAEPALAERNSPLGVEIPNTARLKDLAPFLARLSLVAVVFPAFTDGRGFSIARQLRLRGFQGRLRACGPVIADQYRHARGVGFDEIDLPDAVAARQPPDHWTRMLAMVSSGYQLGYGERASILDRRRAARLAQEAAE
jgi:uncharacterized protein (DUF934 family)